MNTIVNSMIKEGAYNAHGTTSLKLDMNNPIHVGILNNIITTPCEGKIPDIVNGILYVYNY